MWREFLENKIKEKSKLFKVLREENSKRGKVRYIVKKYTQWVDNLIKELLAQRYSKNNFCIIAVGGYGRKQLNPYSDIDIMILTENKTQVEESMVRKLYDLFYGLKYECSISVRTIKECIDLSKNDNTIKTSLLDSRFLFGNKKLFKEYSKILENDIVKYETQKFLKKQTRYLKERHKLYGNTVFVLEPNIKEGVGALRDYHTLIWIGRVLFSTHGALDMKKRGIITLSDYNQLRNALYFLWQLRNAMHFSTDKKTDILHLDLREQVAKEMGYESSRRFSSTEKLMRKYYYYSRNLERIVEKYIKLFSNKPSLKNDSFQINDNISINNRKIVFYKEQINIIDVFYIFYYSAVYDMEISLDTIDKIKSTINGQIRKNHSNKSIAFVFRNILSLKKPIGKTIRMMHATGLIDKYIPEFGNICCLTEYSLYHKYTVDEHSIQSLEHLDKLFDFDVPKTFLNRLSHIWKNLEDHDIFILRLSMLLHDIGKIEKKSHDIVGAKLAKNIAKRLKLGKDLTNKLVFLVKNHLLINKIISSRDLEDSKTIKDFTSIVDDKNKLNLLSLVTYADLKSVNDDVWNSWREDLIESLYIQSTYSFENKNYDKFIETNAKESKRVVKSILGENYTDLIENFPDNIFNDIEARSIATYIKNISRTGKSVFLYYTGKDIDKILVHYKNEFGFFNKICGVLTCLSVNIVSAKSYNLKNNMIIDIFDINIPNQIELKADSIEKMLMDTYKKTLDLDKCISNKKHTFLSRREKAKLEISLTQINITIDNNLSDLYTVIRIYAPDRMALLYDITKVFLRFKLYIGMFILDTKGTIAIDTFYIVDERFKKVYSDKMTSLIKSKLYEVLT